MVVFLKEILLFQDSDVTGYFMVIFGAVSLKRSSPECGNSKRSLTRLGCLVLLKNNFQSFYLLEQYRFVLHGAFLRKNSICLTLISRSLVALDGTCSFTCSKKLTELNSETQYQKIFYRKRRIHSSIWHWQLKKKNLIV